MIRVFGVFCIFLAAVMWLFFLATNAPSLTEDETIQFPSSLDDLKKTAVILNRLFDHVNIKILYKVIAINTMNCDNSTDSSK